MSMQRKRETYYNSRKLPFSLCRQPGVNSVINIYSNASGKKTNIILPSQISDLFSLDLLENPKFTLQHFNPVFAILFIGTQLSNYSTTWSINKSCKCTAYNFYHRPECTVERSYEPSTNWKNKILYAPVITEKHVRMMYTCRFSSEMKYPFHRLHYKWE